MKKSLSRARRHTIFSGVALILALLVVVSLSVNLLVAAFPNPVHAAWQRVRAAGAYHFTADIVQTVTPKASLANIGRTVKTQELHLDGSTDLLAETMQVQLWGQGGSIMLDTTRLDVKVEHGKTYTRQGEQAWEEQGDFTGTFAPEGDFLSYLAGMRDLTEAGTETRNGETFTRYTFTISGPDYATYLKKELEQRLARNGELPPDITMDTPHYYRDMSGNGEIWLNHAGMPVRQELSLSFPEKDDEQLSASITTTFRNFANPPALWAWNGASLSRLTHALTPFVSNIIALSGVLAFTTILLMYRRSRRLRRLLAITFSLLLVVTPVLRNARMTMFGEEQQALAAEMDTQGEHSSMHQTAQQIAASQQRTPHEEMAQVVTSVEMSYQQGDDGTDDDKDGLTNLQEHIYGTDPLRADTDDDGTSDHAEYLTTVASIQSLAESTHADFLAVSDNPTADDDEDGLTNGQEDILGTSYQVKDSDMDGLSDYDEVVKGISFTPAGGTRETRYLDPLAEDSNMDGLGDGMECQNLSACRDTDNDGTPDVFDRDNDGDGVPDRQDLSPFVSSASPAINTTFTGNNPLQFVANNLTPNTPTFVEWQLRPTNPDQLWYAYNVLDWPTGDKQGNIQDADGRTFYDLDKSLDATPNSYGDMKLIPMVEVTIHRAPYNLPDTETLKSFNISVRDPEPSNPNEKVLYVPVNLDTDPDTGARVAFSARMPYLAGSSGWGTAHDVRLVWMVQMLLDTCAESKNNVCVRYEKYNDPSIVQVYKDETWYLTGMSIREEHGIEATMLYEDPAIDDNRKDDLALTALASGLHDVFLAGRPDLTPQEIERRFNHTTNGSVSEEQRWGIPNIMRAQHFTYPHIDAFATAMIGTETKKVLDETFTSYAQSDSQLYPTLMYVHTETYRSLNMDLWKKADARNIVFSSGTLTADMTEQGGTNKEAIKKHVMHAFNWAPYRYRGGQWESCPKDEYWNELERRYPAEKLVEIDPTSNTRTRHGQLMFMQLYYFAVVQGLNNIVQVGEVRLKFDNTKIRDDKLYQTISGIASSLAKTILKVIGFVVKMVASPATVIGTWIKDLMFGVFDMLGFLVLIGIIGLVDKAISGISSFLKQLSTAMRTVVIIAGFLAIGGGAAVIVVVIIFVIIVILAAIVLFFVALFSGWISAAYTYIKETMWTKITIAVVVGVIGIITNILMPIINAIYTVVSIIVDVLVTGALLSSLVTAGTSLLIGFLITAAISIIVAFIVIGIVAVFAIVYVLSGKVKEGTVEYNALIAQTVAQIFVSLVYLMVSLIPIIGVIIVGIIGIVDFILDLFGETTLREHFTNWVADNLHGVDILVEIKETPTDEDRTGIFLTDSDKGLCEGNTLTFKLGINNKLEAIAATSSIGREYDSSIDKWTPTRAHIQYAFHHIGSVLNELPNGSNNGWAYLGSNMWFKKSPQLSTSAVLVAGINTRPFNDIKLYSSFALPGRECTIREDIWKEEQALLAILVSKAATKFTRWVEDKIGGPTKETEWFKKTISVDECKNYTARFSTKDNAEKKEEQAPPIGSGIILDVFPATLDRLYQLHWGYGKLQTRKVCYTPWASYEICSDISTWIGGSMSFSAHTDADGDGLPAASDPNDLKWDTDGDGLSDMFEAEQRSYPVGKGGAAYDLHKADTDNDGLDDLEEASIGTNPASADTDNDGVTDYEEVRGRVFTYQGITTRVTSNPVLTDTDGDGMSDSLEKRLHEQSPADFPYHPQVKNPSPVGITVELDDSDAIMVPGESATYKATLKNSLPDSAGIRGTFTQQLPAALGQHSNQNSFYLPADRETSLQTSFTVAADASTQYVWIRNSVQATPVERAPASPGSADINISEDTLIYIDTTPPSSQLSSLAQGQSVRDTQGLIVQGVASDVSGITQVEMSLDGGAWQVVEGAQTWTAALPTTQLPEGQHTIRTRATDLVGNVGNTHADRIFVVDLSPPVATIATDFISMRLIEGKQTIRLAGTVSDDASDIHMVEVLVMDAHSTGGNGWQTASVSGSSWQIDYQLASFDMTQNYTVAVRSTDHLGNQTSDDQLITRSVAVDSTIPSSSIVGLSGVDADFTLTREATLNGVSIDTGKVSSGVQQAEVAYQPFDQTTIIQDTTAMMRHSFDTWFAEDTQTTYYDQSGRGNNLTCQGKACPDSVDGRNGTALSFQQEDKLTAGPIDLSNRSFTVAFWAKRNGINRNDYVVGQGPGWTTNQSLHIGFRADNRFTCAFWSNDLDTPTAYTDTDWHHWACTYHAETGERVLYRDGQAVARDYAWAHYHGTGPLAIGYIPWNSSLHYQGLLDDVAIYQKALSADEMQSLAQVQDLSWSSVRTGHTPSSAYHLSLPLDDAAGTTSIGDLSGNGHSVTCSGSSCPEFEREGMVGKAASFTNVDRLEITTPINLANQSFSVAFWAKRDGINRDDYVVGQGPGWTDNQSLHIGFRADNHFNCAFWANDLVSPTAYTDTDWHHWTCTYDAETRERVLYRDGQEVARNTAPTHYQGTGPLAIGYIPWNRSLYYHGLLDDVAIFKKALAAEEVQSLLQKDSVTYHLNLPLDDAAGTTSVSDLSGNGHSVTCSGDTCPDFEREGKAGSAAYFNNDLLLTAAPINLANQSFSVALWAKRDGINQTDFAIMQGEEARSKGLHIGFHNTNQFACAFWANDLNTPTAYTDTDWHHWVCTYDATTRLRTIFRDGNIVAQDIAAEHYQGSGVLRIGGTPRSEWSFNGLLDNVQILPYAVSSIEARALHENSLSRGTERFLWSLPTPNNLEGYYAIYVRATDNANNRGDKVQSQMVWAGEIDTLAPRIAWHPYDWRPFACGDHTCYGWWGNYCSAEDLNVNPHTFSCRIYERFASVHSRYRYDPISNRINLAPQWWNPVSQSSSRLYRLETYGMSESMIWSVWISACDIYNNCSQTKVYPSSTSAVLEQEHPIETVIIEPGMSAQVLTTTQQMTVTTVARAETTIKELTLLVNGEPYTTANYLSDILYSPYSGTQVLWSTIWTPPGEGQYLLRTEAADIHGLVTTPEQTMGVTVTVDSTPPSVALAARRINMSYLPTENARVARIPVRAQDKNDIDQVQGWRTVGWSNAASGTMTLDDGSTTPWSVFWGTTDGTLPDGGTYAVSVRAIDRAGNTTIITEEIEADLKPPEPVDMTLLVDDGNGTRVITPGTTIRTEAPTLLLEWGESSDGSGIASYRAGWTTSATLDADTRAHLASSSATDARRRELNQAAEAQVYYAHLVIEDGFGNTYHQYRGPVYVDSPQTPDIILDASSAANEAVRKSIPPHLIATKPATATEELALLSAYTGWLDNGCSLVGTDRSLVRNAKVMQTLTGTQQLNMTWNEQALRFAWSGADFARDGDLFIYLDTRTDGGTVRAYNPYATMLITPTGQPSTPQAGQYRVYLPVIQNGTTGVVRAQVTRLDNATHEEADAAQRGGKPFTIKPTGNGTTLERVDAPWKTQQHDAALAATAVVTDGKLPQVGLPFAADYLIWITDTTSIAILRWDGDQSDWVQDRHVPAHLSASFDSDAQRTDVVVPFTDLNIDDPSATPLKLVALASSDDHLNLWAAIPGPNPLNHPHPEHPCPADHAHPPSSPRSPSRV